MKKKMCLTAAALLCAFAAPAAQAAAIPQTAAVPSHFETAWEQLLAQYGITKPGSSSNNNGNNSNNSGNGSNNSGNGSNSTAARAPVPRLRHRLCWPRSMPPVHRTVCLHSRWTRI